MSGPSALHRQSSPAVDRGSQGSDTPAKKRKHRTTFSCAECRRLKLKCDRQFPCENCVRRRCASKCPGETRPRNTGPVVSVAQDELLQRLNALEELIQAGGAASKAENGIVMTGGAGASAAAGDGIRHDFDIPDQGPSQPNPRKAPNQLPSQASFATPDNIRPFDYSLGPRQADTTSTSSDIAQTIQTNSSPNVAASRELRPRAPSPQAYSYGSLLVNSHGSTRYLGPTATSEWLRDQEIHTSGPSPVASRQQSPEQGEDVIDRTPNFPFDRTHSASNTSGLLGQLPSHAEARSLVGLYFRYFAWHHDIIPSADAYTILDKVCEIATVYKQTPTARVKVDFRELALVYLMLAHGVLHNLEVEVGDPSAGRYLALAKTCLAKSNFMENTSITGIQAVHLMAHLLLETESGRNGESTWPLWGLNMRLIQAMGLHRDGLRWGLPEEVNEIRRRVFWESYAADVMQANCFSRPPSIIPGWIDTQMPRCESEVDHSKGTRSFSTCKFDLALISARGLDMAMQVQTPTNETIADLSAELHRYERELPFHLRCRTALKSLPSVYPDPENAERDSPPLNKSEFHLTLKQFTLAINICETVLFLHRPYFARGLHENAADPLRTAFGLSYLAVVERCNVIVNLMTTLYDCYPAVVARYWWPWHHTFTAAVCMATMILKSPRSDLVSFALAQMDTAIKVFSKAVGAGNERQAANLHCLERLRTRVQLRLEAVFLDPRPPHERGESHSDSDEDESGLIGWRTRLVQRVAGKVIKTSSPTNSSTSKPLVNSAAAAPATASVDAIQAGPSDTGAGSIDDIMQQFWIPMLSQGVPVGDENNALFNWWDWTSPVENGSSQNP